MGETFDSQSQITHKLRLDLIYACRCVDTPSFIFHFDNLPIYCSCLKKDVIFFTLEENVENRVLLDCLAIQQTVVQGNVS